MKKNVLTFALGLFVPLLLAGCGNQQQNNEKSAEASRPQGTRAARATLTVSPNSVSSCEKGAHIDPTVGWQRIDTSIQNLRVTVSSPGSGEEKLFSEGGYQGSAKAGDWVVAGVTFRLYDGDKGESLASYTVASAPCAGGL